MPTGGVNAEMPVSQLRSVTLDGLRHPVFACRSDARHGDLTFTLREAIRMIGMRPFEDEAIASAELDRDQTHYLGDDCPGGHLPDVPEPVASEQDDSGVLI